MHAFFDEATELPSTGCLEGVKEHSFARGSRVACEKQELVKQ